MSAGPDLTVIIPTRDRAESLREALACLAETDRRGLEARFVVVDNGSRDETSRVVDGFRGELPVSYLFEPRAGKGHALNRALKEAPLGPLVAVLDDDMSPDPGWVQGVTSISERWPEHDFFTGRCYVIWPRAELPGWARDSSIRGWAFSVAEEDLQEDAPIRTGRWALGGHFWFRRRALALVPEFEPIWLTEPWFMLQLQEAGRMGVMGPDAVTGHRIQEELLNLEVIRPRAVRLGREVARISARCRQTTRPGRLLHRHPLWFRAICVAALLRWGLGYAAASTRRSGSERVVRRLVASERLATFSEHLRIAGQVRREWAAEAASPGS